MKKLFPVLIFLFGIILGLINIEITNKDFINILVDYSLPKTKKELSYKLLTSKLSNYKENTLNYLNKNLRQRKTTPVIKEESKDPLIYIYNTHQTEEYETSTILDYSIKPTVTISNYILEEIFNKNKLYTYVEESSVKEILNKNSWNYAYSYKATRILLEQRKQEYPTLKYFIDIHRDSITKDKTTVTINNKSYAKILFLIGLENPNYQENLIFTEKLNNKLNQKYPNLTKGIYKKGGPGVNGVYNQDFSKYLILVEMGGYQNTPIEVLNSSLALAECFMEVINEY